MFARSALPMLFHSFLCIFHVFPYFTFFPSLSKSKALILKEAKPGQKFQQAQTFSFHFDCTVQVPLQRRASTWRGPSTSHVFSKIRTLITELHARASDNVILNLANGKLIISHQWKTQLFVIKPGNTSQSYCHSQVLPWRRKRCPFLQGELQCIHDPQQKIQPKGAV